MPRFRRQMEWSGSAGAGWRLLGVACLSGTLLGACATVHQPKSNLNAIQDELASQRKLLDDQRRSLDELRIRVEQLEAARGAPTQAPAAGTPHAAVTPTDVSSLPVVKLEPPPVDISSWGAPKVDTSVPLQDPSSSQLASLNAGAPAEGDQPVDLNRIIAKSAPAETAFATAVSFYNAGDFADASSSFKRFVARYPRHKLVAQALYLHGMCLVAVRRWAEAAPYFKLVIKSHSRSDSMPGSLLALARCETKMGHRERARPLLRRVVSEFPASAEATQAKATLEALGEPGRS